MAKLPVIFMGSAELACPSLQTLADDPQLHLLGVVTQPDRPKGRNLKLEFSEVKKIALSRGLPVLQPERARNPGFVEELRTLAPELIVVVAYGQILPPAILALPRHGCLNVHTSLLPRYRGAAPIQWAILDGETETGVTIMKMDAGLDTGDILTQRAIPIRPEDNAQIVHDRLAALGAELLIETIPSYVSGKINPRPQPAQGLSYARKITREDGYLAWEDAAGKLINRIRAFTPWPGTFTSYAERGSQKLLKIWEARVVDQSSPTAGEVLQADKHGIVVACGAGALNLLIVQPEGGRRMTAQEFLSGRDLKPGDKLGR
jgi:methionyl-tRNA formyltransferase